MRSIEVAPKRSPLSLEVVSTQVHTCCRDRDIPADLAALWRISRVPARGREAT
jgi:hypothetical protein